MFCSRLWAGKSRQSAGKVSERRVCPRLEGLESRVVPYATTGNAWPNPQLITISFVPDGTIVGTSNGGYVYSNLFATFNAKFGSPARWENIILQAAQTWAQQANINIAVVPDSGVAEGAGNDMQGDPTMGDVRISGFTFSSNALAMAAFPPPANNYSVAGDVSFNTAQNFNVGYTYDLYSVALHEFGHALGLAHASSSAAVMYQNYTGARKGLNSDDIAGGQTIYAARTPDQFDTGAGDNSFAAAANIQSTINPSSLTAVANGLNLVNTSDVAYYTFTAPAGSSSSLTVTVQSKGLSQLTPTLTVFGADQMTVLGSASGAGQYGTTLTVTIPNVKAGQQYYVKVAGVDASAFSTGAYALTLNFGNGASPTVAQPYTTTPNGATQSSGGTAAYSTGSSSGSGGLLGGVAGGLFNTVSKTLGFLGSLVGLDTNSGLGAAVGDLLEAPSQGGDTASADNTTYVRGLYTAVLHRVPDSDGLAFWANRLGAGASRLEVAQAFWQSAEHLGMEVDALYAMYLRRAADLEGRANGVAALEAWISPNDLAVQLLTSAEYTQSHPDAGSFVQGLYSDVLGRSATSDELASWSGFQDRAAIARTFLTSLEAESQAVNSLYVNLLGRTADAPEQQGWTTALASGQTTLDGVVEGFLASDEFMGVLTETAS
jgi:hypothetical protein